MAEARYTAYDHASFEWNANGSALIMKRVGVSKDRDNPYSDGDGYAYSYNESLSD